MLQDNGLHVNVGTGSILQAMTPFIACTHRVVIYLSRLGLHMPIGLWNGPQNVDAP